MSHIAKFLSSHLAVDVYDIKSFDPETLPHYQSILIGAGIRYGHFNKRILTFTKKYAEQLNSMKSAFFGVCLTARKPEKRTAETNLYVRKFLTNTPWKPTLKTAIAGALLYPQYKWYDRLAIRLIMTLTGGETDTSKQIEYTDWEQATDFANEFLRKCTI